MMKGEEGCEFGLAFVFSLVALAGTGVASLALNLDSDDYILHPPRITTKTLDHLLKQQPNMSKDRC
jgi:hypothetical protein